GGFTRTLEPREHDHRGGAFGEVEFAGFPAEDLDEFLVDDLDDLLARLQRLRQVGRLRLFAYRTRERADGGDGDVRVEQCAADLGNGGVDVGVSQPPLAPEGFQGGGEPIREAGEHEWSLISVGTSRHRITNPARSTQQVNSRGQLNRASTKSSGLKGARSSGPSPRPTNFTGIPSSRCTAMTIPPLAVPSNLVSTIPETSATSANTWAWRIPFCPVVASSTRSTSEIGACREATRFTLPSSSMRPALFCRRPAVSTMTPSAPSSRPGFTASKATAARSAPSRPARATGTPTPSPEVCSCSAAAARKVSAAPRTTSLSSATSSGASLPAVVVLPVPLTPTIMIVAGWGSPSSPRTGEALSRRSMSGPTRSRRIVRSSARTWSMFEAPLTRTWVRSRSRSSSVGSDPTSATRRVSSISSQSSSESESRESTESSAAPSEPDFASRERRRTI